MDAFYEKHTAQPKQSLREQQAGSEHYAQATATLQAENNRKNGAAGADLHTLTIVGHVDGQTNRRHHIEKNETLSEIAAREFHLHDWKSIQTKVNELAALNHLADPDKIKAGKELNLQVSTAQEADGHPAQQIDRANTAASDHSDTRAQSKAQEHEDNQIHSEKSDKSSGQKSQDQDQSGKSQEKTDKGPKPQEKEQEQNKPSEQNTEATETPRQKALKEYVQEHDHMLALAKEKIKDPGEQNQFATSVRQFESRLTDMAKSYEQQGMSHEEAQIRALKEAQKTYEQVNRLIEAKDNPNLPVTQQQRVTLAEQTMQHAASPTAIDQGQHRTCAVNSVESRMYTSTPSEAARMVADLATTGEYTTTKDNVKVTLNKDDLKPDAEAAKAGKVDGSRDHASQLFQIGAVNVWYAGHEPNLRYEQRKIDPTLTPPDTGERIVDYSSNPPEEKRPGFFARLTGTKEDAYNQPRMTAEKIVYVGDQIEGGKSHDWQLERGTNVKSYEELESKLKDAKEHGKLPLVVTVHTGNEPFYTDSGEGAAGGSGGWHSVTITDYKAGPPASVAVDNQWGTSSDHLGDKRIPLRDMYNAMGSPEAAAAEMEKDLPKDGTPHNRQQQFEALEVARINHAAGKMTDEEFAKTIAKEMSDMHSNGFDARTKDKVTQLLKSLPCETQMDLLKTGKSDGVFDDGNMAYELARIAHKVRQAFDDESQPHTSERLAQIRNLTKAVGEMKDQLPQAYQEQFQNYMSQWHKIDLESTKSNK
jgi:inhibitor of KinA sporulation pathway (predicted exonuclease)